MMEDPPDGENMDSGEVLYEMGEGGDKDRDQWMKVEAAVDTAAVDHVMRDTTVAQVKKKPSGGSTAGKFWWSASNHKIYNEGEKIIGFHTNCGKRRKIQFQIAKVGRTLISADKLAETGHTLVVEKGNPRIICPNKEVIKLRRQNKVFIMDLWIKRSPLVGQ